MSNIRVHELAKMYGIANKEVIVALANLGISYKTHSSSLDDDVINKS